MNPDINANADGGVDITITLSSEQLHALGSDIATFADWTHTALIALAGLRDMNRPVASDSATASARKGVPGVSWHAIISTLDRQMLPRLEGIRDAAIRAATSNGYSLADLTKSLDVPRSTAQYRRQVLTASEPSIWEAWATTGGPQRSI